MLVPDIPRPRALFLDFGGVVVRTTPRPQWVDEITDHVLRLLGSGVGPQLSRDAIRIDIQAAAAADSAWKAAMSRLWAPRELTATRFWSDFVSADWPRELRQIVTAHAAELCYQIGVARSRREVRSGIDELLQAARARDIPIAIVSNALSGAVHRDFLRESGLADAFAAQIYSDEVGVRKPNPEIIMAATRAVQADVGSVWYVGDTPERDVLCSRRAGVGLTVLMETGARHPAPFRIRQQPDLIVADPHELTALLVQACPSAGTAR